MHHIFTDVSAYFSNFHAPFKSQDSQARTFYRVQHESPYVPHCHPPVLGGCRVEGRQGRGRLPTTRLPRERRVLRLQHTEGLRGSARSVGFWWWTVFPGNGIEGARDYVPPRTLTRDPEGRDRAPQTFAATLNTSSDNGIVHALPSGRTRVEVVGLWRCMIPLNPGALVKSL